MNKRQKGLLTYLVSSQGYEPVEVLAEHFSVSTKTIRRDLPVLEELIADSGAKIDIKRGKGVRLVATPAGIAQLQKDYLETNKVYQDRRERNLLQSFFLLFSSIDCIPLKAFSNLLYISRSQLLLDLKAISNVFDPYKVEIVIDKEGIKVNGTEKDINDLAVYLGSKYRDYGYPLENILYPVEIRKGTLITEQLINQSDINFLEKLIEQIEKHSSKMIWKKDYVILFISLLVLIKRKSTGLPIERTEKQVRKVAGDTNLPETIWREIEEGYNTQLDEGDLQTITNIFLATGLVDDPAFSQSSLSLGNKQQMIHDFAEDFIDAFTTITDIDLRKNELFCMRIHEHIGPMINRVLINLGIADQFLETYAQEYHITMNVCEVISWILARKYDLPDIPRAEVLFLMLYIQTEIIEAESRLKVGLLSNDEKSVVNLQLARLSKEFPNWKIVHYQNLSKTTFYEDGLEIVIAISGNLVSADLPKAEISNRMSELDLRLIKSTVFNLASNSGREYTKLNNIFRDLLDLGCQIVFSQVPFEPDETSSQKLHIEGVGNAAFTYLEKTDESNILYIQCPKEAEGNFEFTFSMNNWDFLLFASKIVFLVDRTSQADLSGYIKKIADYLKEN